MLILMTTADIPQQRDLRTAELRRTADWLAHHARGHRVEVLECVTTAGAPLEGYYPVYYAGTHRPAARNKGALLGRALAAYLDRVEVPEPLVLQLTGRYCFLDRGFLELIEAHPGHDLYGRLIEELSGPRLQTRRRQYFTGAFALRTALLREWVTTTDWDHLEREMINVERSLWEFAVRRGLDRFHVDRVNMDANVFGRGVPTRVVF